MACHGLTQPFGSRSLEARLFLSVIVKLELALLATKACDAARIIFLRTSNVQRRVLVDFLTY